MFALATIVGLAVAAPQGPLQVKISPRGGESIHAEWVAPQLSIATDFGRAIVEPEKLEQIFFGDPDVVVAAGVELTGRLDLAKIDAVVGGQVQPFERDALVSVLVLRDGVAGGGVPFAGEWMSSLGPMVLEQRGRSVEGRYGWGETGKIEGRVKDGELEFDYRDGSRSGSGVFELAEAGAALFGSYGEDRFWGAYRKAAVVASVSPGETVSGQTSAGLRYHVHWPADYGADREWPAICILHGSNMSSAAYVATIVAAWPELAQRYVICGLDGERLSRASKPGELRFNYTYVNFGGPRIGPLWAQRQSPALVAEALTELGKEHRIDRWFLGGHSQGGFLTYCLAMFYPDLLAGAFPMSCNLLVQCEPDRFDAGEQVQQHAVPIAVIHGRKDGVVKYSGGAYCHQRLIDGGFPFVQLFAPKGVGHQFALLPVDRAVRWLDAISSSDVAGLADYAAKRAEAEAWRDVGALLARLSSGDGQAVSAAAVAKLRARLARVVEPQAAKLTAALVADTEERGAWIDEFLEFRRRFGTAPGAVELLTKYSELREKQQREGDQLFQKSRRAGNKSDRLAIYRQIRRRCFATKWYEAVKLWSK